MPMDLAAVADTRHRRLRNLSRTISVPVHVGELYNRGATGLAAFRLGMLMHNNDVAKATEFGIEAINKTQINYSAINTPRFMQSVLGSKSAAQLVFQFWKYRVGMLNLIFTSAWDAWKSEDPQTRKEAARTLRGMAGMTFLAAGALGMPLATSFLAVGSILAGLGGDDDEPVDLERDLKNMLTDAFGADAAEVLTKGLWTTVGLDISERVGMGDLANPLSFARFGGTDARSDVGQLLVTMGGAPVGMVTSWVDAVYRASDGDSSRLLEQFPVKGVKDVLRGYRLATEGVETRTGNPVIPPEDITAADVTWRTLGGQPTTLSRYYEGNAAMQEAKKAAEDTRARLIAQYAQARMKGESVDKVMRDVIAYNRRHPNAMISMKTLNRSTKERQQNFQSRNEAGLIEDKTTLPYLDYARFAGG